MTAIALGAREAGAIPDGAGTTFRVWAARARHVDVRFYTVPAKAGRAIPIRTLPLRAQGDGWYEERVEGAGPGTLYGFVLDGRELPDPYARFLPFGVHGPAEVLARTAAPRFERPPALDEIVLYELHVGTFTKEGTYAAAAERLADLAALGVTAIELMPLSTSPGTRAWGYDGVAHFAPFAPYGRPEELAALIARAHGLGLGVVLDVVYNHFGPRGNYLGDYAPEYFTSAQGNPWGSSPDFELPMMRRYVLDNARMWFEQYGVDALRLDATHTMRDRSPLHILHELRDLAASYCPAKLLFAEDDRNDPALITEIGLDAVWADDFHHQVRVLLTGEREGYYLGYEPTLEALARTIEQGWMFHGQLYTPWGRPRGKPADGLDPKRFIYCVENHDQVGNRAFGTRLDRDASVDALAAATTLLLFLPMTPLLFMGQEWAASSPFLYFTDHDDEYGPLVSKGRREEFGKLGLGLRGNSSPEDGAEIPDPQSAETFERSKLRWEERGGEPHRRVLDAVRTMLGLRREDPVLRSPSPRGALRAHARAGVLLVERSSDAGRRTLVVNLSAREVRDARPPGAGSPLMRCGAVSDDRMVGFSAAIYAA